MNAITARPNTKPLRQYLEDASRNASPPADKRGKPVSGPAFQSTAGGAANLNNTLRDIALSRAMRRVEFEARHMGPFNHSGKEFTRTAKPTEGNP